MAAARATAARAAAAMAVVTVVWAPHAADCMLECVKLLTKKTKKSRVVDVDEEL